MRFGDVLLIAFIGILTFCLLGLISSIWIEWRLGIFGYALSLSLAKGVFLALFRQLAFSWSDVFFLIIGFWFTNVAAGYATIASRVWIMT